MATSSGLTELPPLNTGGAPNANQNVADDSESEMQQQWDELISKNMDLPDGYAKVSVLIIKWHENLDQLGVGNEVKDLERLFEASFRYDTQVIELGAERTQSQLISEIAAFAHKNGGDENLLIVYYGGHGIFHKDISRLELVPTDADLPPGFSRVFWNEAESHFIEHVQADVLTIMDCCFASNLVRNVNETGRTFEMLSASGIDQVTPAPGEESFSRALINCLSELVKSSEGGSFTTRDILEKIQKERPHTPPALWRRIPGGSRHIRLSPLKGHRSPRGSVSGHDRGAYLQLGFVLKQSALNKKQIEELTRHIPKAFSGCLVTVRDIKWLGFRKIEQTKSLADLVSHIIQQRRNTQPMTPVSTLSRWSTTSSKRKRSDATSYSDTPDDPGDNKRFRIQEGPETVTPD